MVRGQSRRPPRRSASRWAEPIDPTWWKLFADPQLTALEAQVAAANLDVRIASIRLEESRAQLGIARADEMPQINANGSYTRERVSQKGVIGLLGGGSSSQTGGVGSTGTFTGNGTSANGAQRHLGLAAQQHRHRHPPVQPVPVRVRRIVGARFLGAAPGARWRRQRPPMSPRRTTAAIHCSACWPKSRATTSSWRGVQRDIQISQENLDSSNPEPAPDARSAPPVG